MPSTYLYPGVYVEEQPAGVRPVEGVPTSIAAFVGPAPGGPAGEPKLVHGWEEYAAEFGGVRDSTDAMGLAATAFFQNGGKDAYFARVSESAQPSTQEYEAVFAKLSKVRDAGVLVLPGQPLASTGATAVITAAIAHCEAAENRNRMLIVDPPADVELHAQEVAALGLPTSSYAALYYPWIRMRNPAFDPRNEAAGDETVLVGPSAFVAGMWSKIDGRRGVWKAPAGVETGLLGVVGLAYEPTDGDQGELNPLGVNCLRKMPVYGPIVWGARTLATEADPQWRYVPVRRTAIMIEQSVLNGIRWAVFEPNDHRLWSSLRAGVGSFMETLFRAGAFQGEKSSDAYFVRCGLGDTMTQADVDAGRVILVVGFAPVKPAEFVVLRIQQQLQQ